jgi:hypothetical protein
VVLKRRNNAPSGRKSGSNGAEIHFEWGTKPLVALQGRWILANEKARLAPQILERQSAQRAKKRQLAFALAQSRYISMPQCFRPCRSSGALGRFPCALCRTKRPYCEVASFQVENAAQQFIPPPCSPSRSAPRRLN